jgi:hypothetical protein
VAICSLFALGVAPAASSASGVRALGGAPQWSTLKPPPAPAWYTPELHRKVLAAGPKGVALPSEAAIPASSLAFLGIRPGQLIMLTNEAAGTTSLCTSNFIFNDTNGNFFVGTAGHCGEVGDTVDMLFLPVGLANIGKVVQSTGDAGIGNDFALISIDPGLYQYVSPSMAFWGGPTGANASNTVQVVEHVGWGLVIGTGGTPRVGVGTEFTQNEWWFVGAITPGDSGSGARTLSSLAAGNITHIAIDTRHIGDAAGTSISKILQILGSGYQLTTCASAVPWPLPGCPS